MATKTIVPVGSWGSRRAVQQYGKSPRTTAIPLRSEYGSPEWLAQRRGLVGASEIAAVLGESPFASPFSLWWAKRGGPEWEWEGTLATYLGHVFEPIIADLFAERRTDLIVSRPRVPLWQHPTMPWIGCSPDFLAIAPGCESCTGLGYARDDVDGETVQCLVCAGRPGLPVVEPVECKSDEGGHGWGRPGTDEVPRHHWMQLVQQCMVFGARRGHLVRMAGKRFTAYVVPIDDKAMSWFDTASFAAGQFMYSLEQGTPPDIDGHKATTDALERLHPDVDPEAVARIPDQLVDQYEAGSRALKDVKAVYAELQNRIRVALGDAKTGVRESTGLPAVERRVYKRSGYEVGPAMVDALYHKSPKGK